MELYLNIIGRIKKMATKTAYRWNANNWYFTAKEISEDPDFPGEYNLPSHSTWTAPMADTETQWPYWNGTAWELRDLSMADRLAEGLITQEEYDEWADRQDDEFISALKTRADLNAGNIALVADVTAEAEARTDADNAEQTARENADTELSTSLNAAIQSITELSASLSANSDADAQNKADLQASINSLASAISANGNADNSNKTELQTAIANLSTALTNNTNADTANKNALQNSISALQNTVSALQTAVNSKADVNHTHNFVNSDYYAQTTATRIADNTGSSTKTCSYTPSRDGMFLVRVPSLGSKTYPAEATIVDDSVGVKILDFSNSGKFDITVPVPAKGGHSYDLQISSKVTIDFA